MFGLSTLILLLPLTLASPITSLAALQSADLGTLAKSVPGTCSAESIKIPVPAGLALSTGQKTSLVTVGRGTQNYTCINGTFVSAGAVAE